MILLTGGVGFIASNVLATLNARGRDDVLLVDDCSKDDTVRRAEELGLEVIRHASASDRTERLSQYRIRFPPLRLEVKPERIQHVFGQTLRHTTATATAACV